MPRNHRLILIQGLMLAGFIVITFCATVPGALFVGMPGAWYEMLRKPAWNPPSWVFGPAWTLLYTLMAVAAWLVWKRERFSRPLGLYFVQLLLNAAWTPVFFGAHEMGWALVVIVALWIMILLTWAGFRRVSTTAAWLLVPYLAWVTFAALLNFSLWEMNRG